MSQSADDLGRNGCFLVVLAEVVCVLGAGAGYPSLLTQWA